MGLFNDAIAFSGIVKHSCSLGEEGFDWHRVTMILLGTGFGLASGASVNKPLPSFPAAPQISAGSAHPGTVSGIRSRRIPRVDLEAFIERRTGYGWRPYKPEPDPSVDEPTEWSGGGEEGIPF